ncbi:MAG: hypothetical protein IT242_07910 [Bacteroidia bacterium]|nr:hypothetical protein [Bacteroidia bacterium]
MFHLLINLTEIIVETGHGILRTRFTDQIESVMGGVAVAFQGIPYI